MFLQKTFPGIPCFRVLAFALLMTTALPLIAPPPLQADLDVNIPPGTPLDWCLWRSGSAPDSEYGNKKENNHAAPTTAEGSIQLDDKELNILLSCVLQSILGGRPIDPWAESGVTTIDVPVHQPWFGKQKQDTVIPSSPDYKPAISTALRFKVLGQFVRILLFGGERISVPETVLYLTVIGQPSIFAAKGAQQANADPTILENGNAIMPKVRLVKSVCTLVLNFVGEPAGPPPNPGKGQDQYENMVRHLLTQDLGSAYAYDYDPDFAAKLKMLGPGILPYLIETAREFPHPLVSRNAAALADSFFSDDITSLFRELLQNDDDVIRFRALVSLVKRGDREAVPVLLELFNNRSGLYRNSGYAWALGKLGDARAEKPVVMWLEKASRSGARADKRNYLWTGLGALARLQAASPEAVALFKNILKHNRNTFDPIHQMAVLGLASGRGRAGVNAMKKYLGKNNIRGFNPAVTSIALDVLNGIQDIFKKDYLLIISKDKKNPPMLRYQAMRNKKFAVDDLQLLESLANKSDLAALRGLALVRLAQLKSPHALAIAKKIVTRYCRDDGDSYEALIALRLLGPRGKLTAVELSQMLDQALARKKLTANKNKNTTDVVVLRVPVLKTVLFELGRMAAPETSDQLIRILQDAGLGYRAEAARALGRFKGEKVIRALAAALHEHDSWLNYWAAASLGRITGKTDGLDWFFADKEQRQHGISFWQEWIKNNF
ncbi:HEAT repeat domain-containing protein [Planctomycetota bacterium]